MVVSMRKLLLLILLMALLVGACARDDVSQATPGGATPDLATIQPALTQAMPTRPPITPTPTVLQGTLTIWHSWNEEQVALLEEIVGEFQQAYPQVLFDVLYIPQENLLARFELAWQEGSAPDLFLGPAAWGPGLYQSGWIEDLSAVVDDQLLESINPPLLDSVRYQGALLGLPYAQQGVVLYRNIALAPDSPATFDDLVRMANETAQGDILGAYLDQGFFFAGGHLQGLGGQLMDGDGMPAFNSEQGLTWLELLQKFSLAGPTDFATDQDIRLFQEGRVGWIIDGTWNLPGMVSALGQENLAIDPWPAYKGHNLSGYLQPANLYLSASAAEPDQVLALKFAEYLLSTENQAKLSDGGFIPVVSGLRISDPRQARLLGLVMSALAGGTAYPIAPEIEFYLAPLDIALQDYLTRDVPASEALATAEQAIQAAIEQSRATPVP